MITAIALAGLKGSAIGLAAGSIAGPTLACVLYRTNVGRLPFTWPRVTFQRPGQPADTPSSPAPNAVGDTTIPRGETP